MIYPGCSLINAVKLNQKQSKLRMIIGEMSLCGQSIIIKRPSVAKKS